MNSREFVMFSHYTVLNDPQKKSSANGTYYVFVAANNRQRIPCLCFDSVAKKVEALQLKKGNIISFAAFEDAFGVKENYDYKVISISVADPKTGLTDFHVDYRVAYTVTTEPEITTENGSESHSFIVSSPSGKEAKLICTDEMIAAYTKLKIQIGSIINFCAENLLTTSSMPSFKILFMEFYEKPVIEIEEEVTVDLMATLKELLSRPFQID